MTKGILILRFLLGKRRLAEMCGAFSLNYKFCHAVAHGRKPPTWKMIDRFRLLFPAEFWFEEADASFANDIYGAYDGKPPPKSLSNKLFRREEF